VNAPKGVLTETLRAQIAEHKQELLQFLSDYEQSATFTPPPILRRTNSDSAPLSFAQERLWFLGQLEPGSPVYNICRATRLTGRLNIAALESSLSEIVRRHEILRSQIRVIEGRPMQVTVSSPEFKIHFTDLRSLTRTELDEEIRRQIRSEGERQFDLSAGLFFRAVLLKISDDQHILILTTHHIVSDAWSMGILTKEVWTLYDAYANGRPSPLQELPVQYTDYAVWQHEWLQGDVVESQLSYWKEQLRELPILDLPTDHPRPAKQSFRGARQPIALPESLTKAVNELSEREGVTQFMTLLATFQVLLYRYSGQEDVVVGLPIANRNRTEVEGLIGFFVNTLVLRSDLSGNPTFRQLISRVRDVCLVAYGYQDLPFEKLVQELHPKRDLSRNPLFQVMFVLQNTPRPFPQSSGLCIERVDVLTATSPFDLSLYLRERDGKFIGFFEYNTDLFEPATIERMIGHFETLLKGIVSDPEQPISTLPLLTEAERHQLLVEWNDTTADYPKDSCIHELFEEQVERTPDTIAVRFKDKQLTYQELNARANQVANYLRRLGVRREKRVGICVDRSLEMIVGLLGILKAGGAYVPLDPVYPSERLKFMLNDAQISTFLTQKSLICQVPRTEALAVCLDDLRVFDQENKENPTRETQADSAAYVIYTSGSTGTPKGVVGLHRGTVNRFAWMWSTYPFAANEMSCVKTSLSFVDSVWEVFGPLLKGTPSIIIPDQVTKDLWLLVQALADNHVTRIVLVPSLLGAILDFNPNLQSLLPDLKLWTSSGESLSRKLAERFHQCLPNSKLLNLYGSSEVSGDVTCFETRKAESSGTISVGRPIYNTQVYLLDSHLQPVPIGVSGEICVGGVGLAREYLNRPPLTAERFIPNSFSSEKGLRLYRTGDLARYLSDGNIEFLGRVDNRVKIRGYRIELGEIEAVLNQHPAVKDAVVVVRERDSSTEKRLVSYVVTRQQSPSLIPELQNFLKRKLPEYMIPSFFVMLDSLPLTPNGKLDRQALPVDDVARAVIVLPLVEARTEIEEVIGQIWREVLGVQTVGVKDNFFELGGHSLLAIQLVSRMREIFRLKISVRTLFDAPTIAGVAERIERIIRGRHKPDLCPILAVPREAVLPLSMNQEQSWSLDQIMPGTHFFNMPFVYTLNGQIDIEAFEKTIKEIIGRHEALRTVFVRVSGRPVQVIKEGSNFEMPIIDLSSLTLGELERQATALILKEREGPFDLATGPLVRIKLIRLTDTKHLLLVTMHHMVSDQWSMRVFRHEIAVLYDAFSHRQPSPLPELVIQFADYACWERRLLDSNLFNKQLSYWKKQLAGPVPRLEFQKSRDVAKELSFYTGCQPIEFEEALHEGIVKLALVEKCTSYMVLVTALYILLFLLTNEKDIRVGTLMANRSRKETEGTIGHFLNTVILRAKVNYQMTAKQLLRQVRNLILAASAHQELPFEQLARVLEEEQNIDRKSLFKVLVNYQSQGCDTVEMSGLSFASLDLRHLVAGPEVMVTACDLIFNWQESSTKLTGTVNYKKEIFEDCAMRDLMKGFYKILEVMISQPEQRVSSFSTGVVA
jgi:amino acid adenylation domain-containing protein